jgi:hypothetical protein
VAFDPLRWGNLFLDDAPIEPSSDGIDVSDLSLEGIKWDKELRMSVGCGHKKLISVLPIVELVPTLDEAPGKDLWCPIYGM